MDCPLAIMRVTTRNSLIKGSQTMNKIKQNWRPLLVVSTVVWAVGIFVPVSYEMDLDGPEAFLMTLGPFVIAMAIYFLFSSK
jgi:putative effector of murein hydrolase